MYNEQMIAFQWTKMQLSSLKRDRLYIHKIQISRLELILKIELCKKSISCKIFNRGAGRPVLSREIGIFPVL